MSSKSSLKQKRPNTPRKRTPRTLVLESKNEPKLPAVISETFNLKNFDLVGKIDDMRILTKELSIIARQIEQWMNIAYTISMAFKDNGVLKDVLRALSNISAGINQSSENKAEVVNNPPQRGSHPIMPFPFPMFGQNDGLDSQGSSKHENNTNSTQEPNPFSNINIFEILNNPAFKEIMSKLFQQEK
ncbi:hypothetical protein BHF71_02195 [Vulcanibacillus modesticaldus]|uniref:Uncharacterized protein n=1 Tax=Vulcanibacillus modesticaldus TaxID=337097 RepID=A0A1D2YUV0_9BACI|nr:hypothetical protein [Vulcanibacillus modesticaldus]OEF99416.1 hypothetical protein BHF71_02195 [Vulcanibacillus modesticaldus]